MASVPGVFLRVVLEVEGVVLGVGLGIRAHIFLLTYIYIRDEQKVRFAGYLDSSPSFGSDYIRPGRTLSDIRLPKFRFLFFYNSR